MSKLANRELRWRESVHQSNNKCYYTAALSLQKVSVSSSDSECNGNWGTPGYYQRELGHIYITKPGIMFFFHNACFRPSVRLSVYSYLHHIGPTFPGGHERTSVWPIFFLPLQPIIAMFARHVSFYVTHTDFASDYFPNITPICRQGKISICVA